MSQRREFDFIGELRRRQASDARVPLGIGDDTAVLLGGPSDWLVTVDMLVEGVHFDFATARPREVGRKALAVNLSDIAAMAGTPVAALVAIAIPPGREAALAEEITRGIEDLATEFHVAIAGGDTNSSKRGVVVSITLLGHPTGKGAVRRSGARAGDALCVTGRLGYSGAGRHLLFPPRVREAQLLHQAVDLHAMLDLSDGLASDVFHLAHESACGFVIDASKIPIAENVGSDERSALDHALNDGEDFELFFTVSQEDAEKLLNVPPFLNPSITVIGEATAERGVFLREGSGRKPLDPGGFVHGW